jgi:hypothetical protein
LAPVEVALIAHFLSAPAIVAFGRCCRRLLSDCSSPLAWQHTDSIAVSSFQTNLVAHIRAAPLLRHAPLTIVWHRRCHLHVAELVTLPNVRELDIRWPAGGESHFVAGHVAGLTHARDLPDVEWIALLTHTQLRSLRFAVWFRPSPRVLELAAALPSLRSLSFACSHHTDAEIDLVAPFIHATQLTTLELHFGWRPHRLARESLRKLSSVRHLALRGILFRVDEFPLLFGPRKDGLSSLCQLESLSLGGFNMRSSPHDDHPLALSSALTSMHRLRTFTLSFVGFIDDALHALQDSSSLRLLILHVRPHPGASRFGGVSALYTIPSREALQALLHSNPQLYIRIHCAKTERAWEAHAPTTNEFHTAQGLAAAAAAPSEPFATLSALVSDRLHLLDELDEHRVPLYQYLLAQPLGLFGHTPLPPPGPPGHGSHASKCDWNASGN